MGFSIRLVFEHNTVIMGFFEIKFEFNVLRWATPYVRYNEIGIGLKRVTTQVSNDLWLSTHFRQFPIVTCKAPSQRYGNHCRYGDHYR